MAPGGVAAKRPEEHLLRLFPLMALIFYEVSGGPFGSEDAVGASSPAIAMLGFIVFPLVWSVPEALITAEMSVMYPEDCGVQCPVHAATGSDQRKGERRCKTKLFLPGGGGGKPASTLCARTEVPGQKSVLSLDSAAFGPGVPATIFYNVLFPSPLWVSFILKITPGLWPLESSLLVFFCGQRVSASLFETLVFIFAEGKNKY